MKDNKKYIHIKGANEHNLKNIDIDIPRDEFTVVTGLSGSGKSSLAFDTIYAEGQRRYIVRFTEDGKETESSAGKTSYIYYEAKVTVGPDGTLTIEEN